eukprot:7380953-Prymnesium_polylepis.1
MRVESVASKFKILHRVWSGWQAGRDARNARRISGGDRRSRSWCPARHNGVHWHVAMAVGQLLRMRLVDVFEERIRVNDPEYVARRDTRLQTALA